MQLSFEQVAQMAPDAASVSAGKKLLALKNWQESGISPVALWGLCRGSRVYQVKVDLTNMGYACSCPSRKFPCKHVLGLLMLFAETPDAVVAENDPPEWVAEWLEKRRAREEKKEAKESAPPKPIDHVAQQKRAAKRESLVAGGVEQLSVWLDDLIRNGLGGLEAKPYEFWETQAKRLVDAQAPGLANRVRGLAEIPGVSRDWPERLLAELGRLKLLLHAFERIEQIAPDLQAEVRQLIGWNVNQQELMQAGELVQDEWLIFGQRTGEEERFRTQRSWAVGRETLRSALLLQFAPGVQGFPESIVPGTVVRGKLAFYPGASQQRARFVEREDPPRAITGRIPGSGTFDEFLNSAAEKIAAQPWLVSMGIVLHDVTVVVRHGEWFVRDQSGIGVRLQGADHWKLPAVTGGHPCDVTGEWNGEALLPMSVLQQGRFEVLS